MKLIYKNDTNHPSIILENNGYLACPIGDNLYGEIVSFINDIHYIKQEDNIFYFHEWNILEKIYKNEENYFNFDKSIIDIGAQWGCYSFKSNFKYIYSFEPNIIAYSLLNVNLLIHNKFECSQTYNVCLSDKIEEVEYDGYHIHIEGMPFNDLSNDLDNSRFKEIKKIKTHILDEFNCENVGLIKIDVEGYEEKVLRGGLGTIIRNNYPPILFECFNENDETKISIIKFLNDLGYKILWNWGDYITHLAIHN